MFRDRHHLPYSSLTIPRYSPRRPPRPASSQLEGSWAAPRKRSCGRRLRQRHRRPAGTARAALVAAPNPGRPQRLRRGRWSNETRSRRRAVPVLPPPLGHFRCCCCCCFRHRDRCCHESTTTTTTTGGRGNRCGAAKHLLARPELAASFEPGMRRQE